MSRSHRKTPFVAHTTCRSERFDKQLWHQRWRSRERATLSCSSPEALSSHLPLLEKQVSNVWSMGKDGRHYWPLSKRIKMAERIADRQGHTTQEKMALKKRLLHKWMGK